jgi:hypothetical protein
MSSVTSVQRALWLLALLGFSQAGYSAGEDFQSRCAAPGVLKCISFDTAADFTHRDAGGYLTPADDGQYHCTLDTTIRAGGAGSLNCEVPGANGANGSGGYSVPIGQGFGENSTFYVQYRMRIDAPMLTNNWTTSDGTITSWKQSNFHRTGSTCGQIELTTVKQPDHKIPLMYTGCGTPTIGISYSGDFGNQSGDYDCRYSAWRNDNYALCFIYPIDTWMTFYYKIHIGTYGTASSSIEAWVAPDGQAMKKWQNVTNFTLRSDVSAADVYDYVLLTGGYMTNRAPNPALPTGHMWYDELIVSSQPIVAPGGAVVSPPVAPAAPPAAPSGIQFQSN